ncbi:MAG: hypothetical protein D6808_03235 [Candidatus Dadabacteria bacterium]|nr:MAG: hypothetical protein D6808_03235 [Candidatus Dadabacteria bacterium]
MPAVAIVISLLLFSPPLSVRWVDKEKTSLRVDFLESKKRCLAELRKKEISLKFRFKVRVCKRRRWTKSCRKELTEIHDLKFDPVTEKYKVSIDRLDDKEEPVSTTYDTKKDAVARTLSINLLDLKSLDGGERLKRDQRRYLQVRLISRCKKRRRHFFSNILPFVLTFGLIDNSYYDTGWIDFHP